MRAIISLMMGTTVVVVFILSVLLLVFKQIEKYDRTIYVILMITGLIYRSHLLQVIISKLLKTNGPSLMIMKTIKISLASLALWTMVMIIPNDFIRQMVINPQCYLPIMKNKVSVMSSPITILTIMIPISFTINTRVIAALTNGINMKQDHAVVVFVFLVIFFICSRSFLLDMDKYIVCFIQ